jgi:hypothetical protein
MRKNTMPDINPIPPKFPPRAPTEKKNQPSVDLADESVAGEEDPGASLDITDEKKAAGFIKPTAPGPISD